MKQKLTLLFALVIVFSLMIPSVAYAREIKIEIMPGYVWTLVIPDEFFASFALPVTPSPTNSPTYSPAPTPAPSAASCPPAVTPVPTATAAPIQTPTPTVAPTPTATPAPTASPSGNKQATQNSYEAQMLSWVNAERVKTGLPAYQLDPSLTYWARAKSQDMHDLGYFSHTSPTYGNSFTMLKNAGISFMASGENIARYGALDKAHAGLMSSPGHYANIMSSGFKRVGIGVVRTSSGVFYVTQLFVR